MVCVCVFVVYLVLIFVIVVFITHSYQRAGYIQMYPNVHSCVYTFAALLESATKKNDRKKRAQNIISLSLLLLLLERII